MTKVIFIDDEAQFDSIALSLGITQEELNEAIERVKSTKAMPKPLPIAEVQIVKYPDDSQKRRYQRRKFR